MGKRLGSYLPEQLILKITLQESEPKIWRRVEVFSGLTLLNLHFIIQCVFDWTDSHLFQFWVTPGGKLTRAARRDARRYHVLPPDPFFGDDAEGDRGADEVIIGRIFTADCKQILYEYDFGDSWEHLVKLEKRLPGGDPEALPRCLAGENAAPVDDTGGIYGYYEFLAALRDPTHDMHDTAIEWLGEDFDPARFDLEIANRRLSQAFKPAPKPRRAKRPKTE